mmetsp:Transcript_18763/g.28845  ORF Transcript_18763/g.28845 Transcript_18763/m.28845 type:complete len:86 (-) Transcript_18763:215-472(-)
MIKPAYKRKQEVILYPETSVLDEFMLEKGLHKKLRHNVKVVNGEVKFNVFKGEKKEKKNFRLHRQATLNMSEEITNSPKGQSRHN